MSKNNYFCSLYINLDKYLVNLKFVYILSRLFNLFEIGGMDVALHFPDWFAGCAI